jgi:hypothetical protein
MGKRQAAKPFAELVQQAVQKHFAEFGTDRFLIYGQMPLQPRRGDLFIEGAVQILPCSSSGATYSFCIQVAPLELQELGVGGQL